MKKILVYLSMISVLLGGEPFSYDPFLKPPKPKVEKEVTSEVIEEKPQVKKRVPLHVEATMGKRVFVNGKWYGIGERIGEYTLYMIKNNVVGFKINDKLYIEPIGGGRSVLAIEEKK